MNDRAAVSPMPGAASRYQLVRRLGAGGMAEVFLGTMEGAAGFRRSIAIKRIHDAFASEPEFEQMFIAEARLAARLNHPNIVSVLDFNRDEDGLFLAMEYVDGRDLAALLATGPVPRSTVIFLMSEVLRGLGYAHELPLGCGIRGLIHRDVSPANVLLSWQGAVKIADFGVAKAMTSTLGEASGSLKGKPSYMSPEQLGTQTLDGRSDLFAVGVMLWEALTGQRLFHGPAKETLAKVLFAEIPAPSRVGGTVPADLERITMRLLARDRSLRYPFAGDAIAALSRCQDAPRNGPGDLVALLAERFEQPMPAAASNLRPPAAPHPSSHDRADLAESVRTIRDGEDAAATLLEVPAPDGSVMVPEFGSDGADSVSAWFRAEARSRRARGWWLAVLAAVAVATASVILVGDDGPVAARAPTQGPNSRATAKHPAPALQPTAVAPSVAAPPGEDAAAARAQPPSPARPPRWPPRTPRSVAAEPAGMLEVRVGEP